jgi:hypothetical protein
MTNQTINLVKAPAVDDAGQTWKPGDFELKLPFGSDDHRSAHVAPRDNIREFRARLNSWLSHVGVHR